MPEPIPVWTGLDVYLFLYPCSVTGVPLSTTPILQYCFLQNATLTTSIDLVQRPGFGNPVRNLVSEDEWDLYNLSAEHFYWSPVEFDMTTIFNRDVRLYIDFWLFGEGRKTNECHTLKIAQGQNWQFSAADNQVAQGQVNFMAPIYEKGTDPLVPIS